MPRALITGITGQDGSYLAELLLEKGYEVHGMVRRASTEKFERIEHIRDRLTLHQGDLLDHRSLVDTLRAAKPEEIYNLAAMSFVAVSWIQPTLTAEFTGVGVTRMLEAMREVCPEARFYQASSSEMFGKVREVPQTETTPFYPRSPYGVAKAYGHHITVNYRESYGLHATSGILFNHECISEQTPLMVREDGIVAVRTPADLVSLIRRGPSVQSFDPRGLLEIWDGADWTAVHAITATRLRRRDRDHRLRSVEARGGIVEVTSHHRMLDGEHDVVRARDLEAGDRLALAEELPPAQNWSLVSEELAEFLGLMAADGYVSRDGTRIDFAHDDGQLRFRLASLWGRLFLGRATAHALSSGWNPGRSVEHLHLVGAAAMGPWLREQLYTRTGCTQVPPLILNADTVAQQAFARGYYAGDGLKPGNGVSVNTNSPVLAQGLCWLYHRVEQPSSMYVEHREAKPYYQLNLRSAAGVGAKGQHLARDPAEVRRIVDRASGPKDEFAFDIETKSSVFCAGVGRIIVHNSPRRGLEFVTRKISWHAAAIRLGRAEHVALGNLDAERDWGYAKDYVEAMWRMLQRDVPEDFVVATGRAHSVRDCVEVAFDQAGLQIADHVVVDESLKRPAEVDHLIGDHGKAKRLLGWEPRTSFEELIRLMVDSDLEALKRGR
jgi:GDPmannose 4,6-dehydratase